VIAFEGAASAGLAADHYVCQISTNTYFRISDTPFVDESLNDGTVLPNGDVRMVWAADDDSLLAFARNIYARTFTLPAPPTTDTTAPQIAIATPADGALYTQNQLVATDYACEDEPGGSGLASCDGPVAPGAAIDTASVGGHPFGGSVGSSEVQPRWRPGPRNLRGGLPEVAAAPCDSSALVDGIE
jgi:hypothetical protein